MDWGGFLVAYNYLILAIAFLAPAPDRMLKAAPAVQQPVLLKVPLVKQPYMYCLIASVSMVLGYYGRDVSPDKIGQEVPVYKDGTAGKDLAEYVEKIGFLGFLVQPPFEELLTHLEKGRPPIVALPGSNSSRHAMVLVGFDPSAGLVWLNDPAKGKCKSLKTDFFRSQWEKGQRWTLLIVPK
jgi:ABC-type bacteriocin/lantibiotic exporter with double-glycine peptidase domain